VVPLVAPGAVEVVGGSPEGALGRSSHRPGRLDGVLQRSADEIAAAWPRTASA
jgi:hypothetical protein